MDNALSEIKKSYIHTKNLFLKQPTLDWYPIIYGGIEAKVRCGCGSRKIDVAIVVAFIEDEGCKIICIPLYIPVCSC